MAHTDPRCIPDRRPRQGGQGRDASVSARGGPSTGVEEPASLRRTRRALVAGNRLTARRRRAIARGPRARPHRSAPSRVLWIGLRQGAGASGHWRLHWAPVAAGAPADARGAVKGRPCLPASSVTPCPSCPPAVVAGVPARSHRARSPLLRPGWRRWTAGACAASPCVDAPERARARPFRKGMPAPHRPA